MAAEIAGSLEEGLAEAPAKPRCPWAACGAQGSGSSGSEAGHTSLADVMSEQLAEELEAKERLALKRGQDGVDFVELGSAVPEPGAIVEEQDCSNDLLIARMLQMQFDSENDVVVANEERAMNGRSKVSVSYRKYKVIQSDGSFAAPGLPTTAVPPALMDSEDELEEDLRMAYADPDDRKRDWDLYETADKEVGQLPRLQQFLRKSVYLAPGQFI